MTPALPQYIVVFIVVRNMRARGMQNRTDVWKCVSQIKSLLLCAGTDRAKAARAAPGRPHAAYARHARVPPPYDASSLVPKMGSHSADSLIRKENDSCQA